MTFSLYAKVPLPRENAFADDMENGANGWTTGGSPNTWAQTTTQSHSPTHSWTDSPSGNYGNSVNNCVYSPIIDLSGKTGTQVGFWHRYDTESGWDFAYPEYSTNGGGSWQSFVDGGYTGSSGGWLQRIVRRGDARQPGQRPAPLPAHIRQQYRRRRLVRGRRGR